MPVSTAFNPLSIQEQLRIRHRTIVGDTHSDLITVRTALRDLMQQIYKEQKIAREACNEAKEIAELCVQDKSPEVVVFRERADNAIITYRLLVQLEVEVEKSLEDLMPLTDAE